MSRAVHYVVARYRPTPELSEFANIGVVAFDAETGGVFYKLSPRRFRRVTQFFDNVEPSTYSEVINLLDGELARLGEVSQMRRGADTPRHMFLSFVQPREGIVTFSPIRSLAAVSGQDAVKTLYARYVRRDPELLPQRELLMVRNIRADLNRAHIFGFKARQIDDELMPIRLPLVSERRERATIKPMAFDQKTTLGIIDHANLWRDRFMYLIQKGIFKPQNIMIALADFNPTSDAIMSEALEFAHDRIRELGVGMTYYHPTEAAPVELVQFAADTAGTQRHLIQ